jgi:hypothetical protein
MSSSHHDLRQPFRLGHALLTRPGETPVRVRLEQEPAAMARAGACCSRMGFPVDAAFALCAEATLAAAGAGLDDLLGELRAPDAPYVPEPLEPWLYQLEVGCGWYEDDLPVVRIPARTAIGITPDTATAALEMSCDPARLAAVLNAERVAVLSGGQRLAEALAGQLA